MKYTVHFTDPLNNKIIAQICESKTAATIIVTRKLLEMHYDCVMMGQDFNVTGTPLPGDSALHAEVLIDDIVVLLIDAKPMLH